MNRRRTPRSTAHRARGLTLIELMLGLAITLFIAAAGATLLLAQLRENRDLVVEARLLQDLRTAADLITRDLRRAGYWGAAADGVWSAGATGVRANPYAALPAAAASDAVAFRYSRDTTENDLVDSNEQFGYRLRAGVIEVQLGAANWQALTDANLLRVTEFSVTPAVQDIDLQSFCPKPCPTASATCPPHQQVRTLTLALTGQRVGDARVSRSVLSAVRVRSDAVLGACAV